MGIAWQRARKWEWLGLNRSRYLKDNGKIRDDGNPASPPLHGRSEFQNNP
jgi:hypothetical protein